jgi:hypothetical protein
MLYRRVVAAYRSSVLGSLELEEWQQRPTSWIVATWGLENVSEQLWLPHVHEHTLFCYGWRRLEYTMSCHIFHGRF